jgi:hypothetical protein
VLQDGFGDNGGGFPRMYWPGQYSINEEHFQLTEEDSSKLVMTVSVISVFGNWTLFEIWCLGFGHSLLTYDD